MLDSRALAPENPRLLDEQGKVLILFARHYQAMGDLKASNAAASRALGVAMFGDDGVEGGRAQRLPLDERVSWLCICWRRARLCRLNGTASAIKPARQRVGCHSAKLPTEENKKMSNRDSNGDSDGAGARPTPIHVTAVLVASVRSTIARRSARTCRSGERHVRERQRAECAPIAPVESGPATTIRLRRPRRR